MTRARAAGAQKRKGSAKGAKRSAPVSPKEVRSTATPTRLGQSAAFLRTLHRALLLPRLVEERMLLLLRQGKISKWFAGVGQEAIAVGVTSALRPSDYILPLHRNLGVFTTRGIPLSRLFAQWQGTHGGFTKGRDRSFHFGTQEYRIVGMISHLGPQLSVADGIALGHTLRGEDNVTAVFTGEGGTSEGDFHEALNVAAVWDLPVLFIIENNGYALSTPTAEQYRCARLSERAAGYGIEGVTIDGNDVLEVYQTVARYAKALRVRPRPVLIECTTFRMRGHEEASGVKYVPPELFKAWEKKDPVRRYEARLARERVLSRAEATKVRAELLQEIDREIESALNAPAVIADTEQELADVYSPALNGDTSHRLEGEAPSTRKLRLVDAISDGLRTGLRRHQNLVLMGQDIAKYGGVFKVTEGFVDEFGADRIRNTPLCESAIVGAALGLSITGYKSIVEMQFADFVTCGFNQIVNNLAKTHYRWGQNADVVVRMPTGAGTGAGPFHSQSNEAWFSHTPGLKVVYPSNPEDAKGLLLAALEDPNPVLYFEHKLLYRSISGEVPIDYYTTPIGSARIVRSGSDVTIITYGAGVHWASQVLDRHADISATLIDLRTLVPLDWETIFGSVRRTGKAIILHEDTLFGGIGGEIAARIAADCFESLDGPVIRSASLDTPIPFARELEQNFLPLARFEADLVALMRY